MSGNVPRSEAGVRRPGIRRSAASTPATRALFTPCNARQVDVVQLQVSHRSLERLCEFPRGRKRGDLGLDDHLLARKPRQDPAQLHLARAIAARGLDMVDPVLERRSTVASRFRCSSSGMSAGGTSSHLLDTHPAAGEHRHLQFRATEAAIFHAP